MQARLARAVAAVAHAAPPEAKDWWIIGSAAMALCGIEGVEPADVDVLGSAATLSRLLKHWRVEPGAPKPSRRFRSHPYVRVELPGCLPIETMGDLQVLHEGDWHPLKPRTRVALHVDGQRLFVPSLREQIDILRLFGRPKDLAKAELIERRLRSGEGLRACGAAAR